MLPDPVRAADTLGWLARARMDLRGAEVHLAASPTHDLVELGGQAAQLAVDLEPLLRSAAPLTEYAWRFRYPGEPAEPSGDEARAALALAERVVGAIVRSLPADLEG